MSRFLKLFSIVSLCFLGLCASLSATAQTINGAGATFPYPVYLQWSYLYGELTGTRINYQSIGSGGGIAQIKAKTVDFGASDAPLSKEELEQSGLMQFPTVIGGVVPVVHISGISAGQLHLTSDLLADLYLGKITKWNDARIKTINPTLNLPDKNITIVHRADGSGTTWIFTNYLSQISNDWKDKVGANNAVDWPIGVGGKGNEGVASYVQQVDGSIGYVEYAYALQNKMAHVLLKDADGHFVAPNSESFQAAASHADWENAPGFAMILVNQRGEKSWPITGASFILMYKNQTDQARARTVLNFFDWAYKNGSQTAAKLNYISMPENVVKLIHTQWHSIQSNSAALWP